MYSATSMRMITQEQTVFIYSENVTHLTIGLQFHHTVLMKTVYRTQKTYTI